MLSEKILESKLEKYQKHLCEQERSSATIQKYLRDVRHFYRFLEGRRITHNRVIAFKSYLLDNYQAVSINSMLVAVNSYLSYIGCSKYRVRLLKIQRRIIRSPRKELNRREYQMLLKASEQTAPRLNLIMQTICATGIRISELNFITTEAVRAGSVQVYCKNKMRVIWLPRALCRKLEQYARAQGIRSGLLFKTRTGAPVNRSNIWTGMKQTAKKAGINPEKVYPHNLRHLFARTYYEQEKDLRGLADLLGHCSIETTRIYTITTGKEHERQLNQLNLII